jgi:bifunctional non-homologous end joining protein LigD
MTIYKPMLAVPMDQGNITDWKDWTLEEKYDGWRLLVRILKHPTDPKLKVAKTWTRPRKHAGADGKTMREIAVAQGLYHDLLRLPVGYYDGEYTAGSISTDVSRKDLDEQKVFIMFDVLELRGVSMMSHTYIERRDIMKREVYPHACGRVSLAAWQRVVSRQQVETFVKSVWDRGGEGAILKRGASRYHQGKRSPDWVKVKKLSSAVLTLVGFEKGEGKIIKRGPFAKMLLEDAQGFRTSVKTVDDAMLAYFNRRALEGTSHPDLGRQVRIDYQDRTRDNGYRHPRFDRWEDE